MISLFLDTTNEYLNVTLVKDKNIIYQKEMLTKNDHSSYLMPFINEGLKQNNLEAKDINLIYSAVGPGSFTGSRIGITVAKTIAFSLQIKVVPISSLKEYIYAYDSYDYYVPIIEDRQGMYLSIYDKNYETILDETYDSFESLEKKLQNLDGKILIISDKNYEDYEVSKRKIDVLKLIEFNKDNGINPHGLKPNYIKKIEVESKL